MTTYPLPLESGDSLWWDRFKLGAEAAKDAVRKLEQEPNRLASTAAPAIDYNSQKPEDEGLKYAVGEAIERARKRVKR